VKSLSLDDAYRCLRLDSGASRLDVERAYRAQKEIYAPGSMATYALLDAEQRRERLETIELAYRTLLQQLTHPRHHAVEASDAPAPDTTVAPQELVPGEELKAWRERRGMSISEVGVRTKISPMTLENLEKQQFARLPAPVYLRGFLVQYLGLLEVPHSEALVERYLAAYAAWQD